MAQTTLEFEAPPTPSPGEDLRRRFGDLLERWGIRGEPVPVETLREMSLDCGLEENELSRALIASREE